MPWRIAAEKAIPVAAGELAGHFGNELCTLVLYGSHARPEARHAGSDVNLAVVAERIAFRHLGPVAQWCARWRAQRFAAPLLLAASDLVRSLDAFPLEILDIQAHHRTLAGGELFTDLNVPAAAVGAACEREAKGRLIRLRELYLEVAGSTRELRALMLESRKTFLLVMRGLLFLEGEPFAGTDRSVVARFERANACRLHVLGQLDPNVADLAVEQHFPAYLADVEQLAAIADRTRDHRR
jgi:hypothetical protein